MGSEWGNSRRTVATAEATHTINGSGGVKSPQTLARQGSQQQNMNPSAPNIAPKSRYSARRAWGGTCGAGGPAVAKKGLGRARPQSTTDRTAGSIPPLTLRMAHYLYPCTRTQFLANYVVFAARVKIPGGAL